MRQALGLLELNSIAVGIQCCDDMLKSANVRLVRANTVCPGKYFVLISGDTGSVSASLDAGKAAGGMHVVDELLLPNAHDQLAPALTGTVPEGPLEALGVLEFFGITSAVCAADACAKAANVRLLDVRIGYAIGGKGVVTLTGTVGDVRAAVKAGCQAAPEGMLVNHIVIPRPTPALMQSLL